MQPAKKVTFHLTWGTLSYDIKIVLNILLIFIISLHSNCQSWNFSYSYNSSDSYCKIFLSRTLTSIIAGCSLGYGSASTGGFADDYAKFYQLGNCKNYISRTNETLQGLDGAKCLFVGFPAIEAATGGAILGLAFGIAISIRDCVQFSRHQREEAINTVDVASGFRKLTISDSNDSQNLINSSYDANPTNIESSENIKFP